MLTSAKAAKLISNLKTNFNRDLHIIIFDNSISNSFSVLHQDKFIDIDSTRLQTYFKNLVSKELVENVGSSKDLNKTFNDIFHEWTYKNLSKFVVISDFDAILIQDGLTIFELKRIEENINTWEPYLDEQAIYGSFLRICKEINAQFRLLAYQTTNEQFLAYHYIQDSSSTAINGMAIIINPLDLLNDPINIYSSSRKRQKRSY